MLGHKDTNRELFGPDLFGDGTMAPGCAGPLEARFGYSPFSIFDSRAGDWRARKDLWLQYGIKSEIGRAEQLAYGPAAATQRTYMPCPRCGFNSKPTPDGTFPEHLDRGTGVECVTSGHKVVTRTPGDDSSYTAGTSVFDPVLCELMYSWFCPPGGQVVDPFAGGSVRGVVAHCLGLKYWGCDLSGAQVVTNKEQAETLCKGVERPVWVNGDSAVELEHAPLADFVFSCPPYGDLEVYSEHPRDLSNMGWQEFLTAYRYIIGSALVRLRVNRFSAFVVADFRDPKTGAYRNFVSETIAAFTDCGALYYNEGILISAVGTAAMRAVPQFTAGRKLAKTHQNVLVFCKGSWREAARALLTEEQKK